MGWEEIRVNLGDEREKADRKPQQVRKDPSGKVSPLKQLWQFLPISTGLDIVRKSTNRQEVKIVLLYFI